MAQIKNCKRCGKIFAYLNNVNCPDCARVEEEEFDLVREFVKDHEFPTIPETSAATGVAEKYIVRWVREGRLERAGYKMAGLKCDSCGTDIYTGKLCEKCQGKMAGAISSASARRDAEEQAKKLAGSKVHTR